MHHHGQVGEQHGAPSTAKSRWSQKFCCPSSGEEMSKCAVTVLQNMDDTFTCDIPNKHLREDEVRLDRETSISTT